MIEPARQPLSGKVALVTGASRGIGKGIALQLGESGALVYITGRTLNSTNQSLGSLEETASEIRNRGGKCIPVVVDHENDQQIANLFEKIKLEQNGQLDILVNNAYKSVNTIFDAAGIKFWEQKPEIWDDVNNVGLRNHYICTVYAARLMVPRKQGLIVNISSFGGTQYLFNVAYGVGKCAVDRMANDCGIELKKHNVTMIALYPGAVKTELCIDLCAKNKGKQTSIGGKKYTMEKIFEDGETIEFSGKVIVALAQDPNLKKYSSKVIVSSEYAYSHGIRDVDNSLVPCFRQIGFMLTKYVLPENLKFVANFIPGWLKIPQFVLDIASSKF